MKSLVRIAIACASIGLAVAAVAAPQGPTTVVLVHGAFADGSAWNKVVPRLQEKGLKVVSVQNPLTSLADDVAATRRVLDAQTGPVVLVGHSWGGVVISEVGEHERVKSLVYVAAFAPAVGQSATDLSKDYPAPVGLAHLVADKEGFLTMTPEDIAHHFAQDLPAAETRLMAVTQGPVRGANFDEKTTHAAWKTRPSWFVLTRQDHMIQPALQESMARNIGANVVSVASSHVPQQSHPEVVVDAILAAASR
ncbi:MAG TPA: alpha/beta hydrolase [Burkholderiaceae bacterium]|jgi:pimeloyl-ACP methyl ester carboxylesterase|nr:alpha/beta hydrolase [Burkholderiaceae bacterium]